MIFRQSTRNDLNEIMHIIKQAQEYFKGAGIDQWQDGYPQLELMEEDIDKNRSYVLLEEQKICGIMSILFDGEKDYDQIYEGRWLTDGKYAAIHRIAVDTKQKGRGFASFMIEKAQELCLGKNIHSIKVDTHRDNIVMQKMLKKQGFEYCGVIYLEDMSERIAFEKNF